MLSTTCVIIGCLSLSPIDCGRKNQARCSSFDPDSLRNFTFCSLFRVCEMVCSLVLIVIRQTCEFWSVILFEEVGWGSYAGFTMSVDDFGLVVEISGMF